MVDTPVTLKGVAEKRDDEIEAAIGTHRTQKEGCVGSRGIRVRSF